MTTVKNIRDTSDAVTTVESERAAARYRLLLEELQREYERDHGKKHGWKTAAAERLGTDQAYVSRIMSRERTSIGIDLVERARTAMNLKHDFFHGAKTPRSYHDYLGGDTDAPYPAWKEFAGTVQGKSMTTSERLTLASMKFPEEPPTVDLYIVFLLVMRGELSPKKRDDTIKNLERLRRENEEDDAAHDRKKPPRK